ncbi:hypothetical protein B0H16DRAFT_1901367 [Mycena metata]|uniref:Uncharacterized protein n=1 Tax=Mycena metata TaxID=1033252 RepID=A0AAD7GX49_9AGAR|nr:hypothetical protein B0H16DRAFT_1901365 [Mycena metata]KAJ7707255.1 hypothetical protein B0H16DRAFT_1901367 [Mycena metata]
MDTLNRKMPTPAKNDGPKNAQSLPARPKTSITFAWHDSSKSAAASICSRLGIARMTWFPRGEGKVIGLTVSVSKREEQPRRLDIGLCLQSRWLTEAHCRAECGTANAVEASPTRFTVGFDGVAVCACGQYDIWDAPTRNIERFAARGKPQKGNACGPQAVMEQELSGEAVLPLEIADGSGSGTHVMQRRGRALSLGWRDSAEAGRL